MLVAFFEHVTGENETLPESTTVSVAVCSTEKSYIIIISNPFSLGLTSLKLT